MKDEFNKDIDGYFNANGNILRQSDLSEEPWSFEKNSISTIKKHVISQGIPLSTWGIQINYGIKTGFNEAFIINEEKKDQLINDDPKSEDLMLKLVRGRDIHRFFITDPKLFIIGTFPARKIDIQKYPAVNNHLIEFGMERLEQSGNKNARKKTNNEWFETQDSISYWNDFHQPKIIYPNMTKYMPFVLDEEGFYTNQKCFIMTGEKLYYLVAFFNSFLFKFCFRENFPELIGGTRELSKVFFENIPVKLITEAEEQPYKEIVKKISALKKADTTADISQLEAELNQMIYEYYGISEEEQVIVEETVKGWA